MTDRTSPSAAASLYPNLPSDKPVEVSRSGGDIAGAMYPHLRPKPAPAPSRGYYDSTVSLATLCDQNPALEHGLAMCGLIRRR
jgi:hypothetical protein